MRFGKSRRFVQAVICGFTFAAVTAFFYLEQTGRAGRTLLGWELRYRDAVTVSGRFNAPDERLIFLGIDSSSVSLSELDLQTLFADVAPGSIEARALEIMAGGWPWSREIYALIAERLFQAGARAVVFDLLFPKPGPGDDSFQDALRQFPGRIVLGTNFVAETIGPGREAWALTLPSTTIVSGGAPEATTFGYVNFWPAFDGVVRNVYYHTTLDQLQGAPPPATVTPEMPASLAARAAATVSASDLTEPFQSRLIRFSGPPGTFPAIPIYQIFVPQYWQRNFAGGEAFRDKIVFVGPAGNWAHDEHSTPFGQMPGPELQINSLNALLHRTFLREWPPWTGTFLIFMAALTAWLLAVAIGKAWLRLGAFVLLGAGYLAGIKLAHDHLDTVVLAIPPLLTLSLGGLGAFIYDYTRETIEKLRVRRTLEAYVSSDVVRDVLDNPASYLNALGGTRAHVALLMTDLRGFTTISEQMDSSKLVAQLNEYLSAMIDDIFAVRGSVDKFIGDAILAVWGHLNSGGPAQDTTRAIDAFFRMRASLQRLNADWEARGMSPFVMGCGINFGEVIFGNIGSSRKMEPTVIGDPVNVVARLESLTKEYDREILIGQAAADLVRESYTLQFIDRVAVKGKTKPLDLYSVIGSIGESRPPSLTSYLQLYESAQTAYRAGSFQEAATLFGDCLVHWPGDAVASLYLQRCASREGKPAARGP